jgi:hypothetical protein
MSYDASVNSRFTQTGQVCVLTGKDIAHLARKAQTATARALLAHGLTNAIVDRLTSQQARQLAKAGVTYASTLRGLTPLDVAAVKDGRVKLADVLAHKRAQSLSNDEVDQLVHDVGVHRVWAALDRATRPVVVAAE